jgi:putative transposase
VIRELNKLVELRGRPAAIRCHDGPEFCAQAFLDWCEKLGIAIRYIQPSNPNQNAAI